MRRVQLLALSAVFALHACATAEDGAGAAVDAGADTAAEAGAGADAAADAAAGADVAADTAAAAEAGADSAADAAPATARLEEVYADRFLNGDKSEFVEITAPAGTPLDALGLRLIDATGKVSYEVAIAATGVTMPASGRWVVGANCVTASGFCPQHVDQTYSITTWGLAGDLGAVQLVRAETTGVPTLLDVVAWGGVPATPSAPPTTVVEGSPAPKSDASGHSIGRAPGAARQHDDSKDFCLMNATAGSANGACL